MTGFVIAAIVMRFAALIPAGVILMRGGEVMAAVVAVRGDQRLSSSSCWSCWPEGFQHSGEFELPVHLAVLVFGSGLVFVGFLGRGL